MNGIYLKLLLKELEQTIIGSYIEGCNLRERIIQLQLGRQSLFISLYPQALAIFVTKKSKPGFEKLNPFSEMIKNYQIVEIQQSGFSPVMKLFLKKSSFGEKKGIQVITSLYRDAPNFSIRTEEFQRNLFTRYVERPPKKSIFGLSETELASASVEQLCKNFDGINKYLAEELNVKNFKTLKEIIHGDSQAMPRLVSINPLKMSLFANEYLKKYSSMNGLLCEAAERFIEELSRQKLKTHKEKYLKQLNKRLTNLKTRLMKYHYEEKYRITGELILANINKIKRGISQIKVFNPYDQTYITIKLNPIKSPEQNAQDYFLSYKKAKRGIPKIKKAIEDLEKEIKGFKEVPGARVSQRLITPVIPGQGRSLREQKIKRSPFREFILSSGAVVYVGKDARSNNELTFKFAIPNDYFFHIRGYEGAHTILRAKIPKGQRPKKEDLNAAAAIAAYFSKARNQKNVAVSYTQRKYLKRNKRGGLGSVTLIKEEVIFVNPECPSH